MSEFLGARISLISKSDIRYSGVLHEINSDESTVSLENVISYGTEGRKGKPEDEIPPADQIYEYIVFRGSDVKDLRIEEAPSSKEAKPPAVTDDPAIVGARARPMTNNAPPPPPPPAFQQGPPQVGPPQGGPRPGGSGFVPNMPPIPPQAGGWIPGGPPPRNFQYPPPPNWYPPQGPGFPPGPGGPGPWGNNFYPPGPNPFPQGVPGAPGPGNSARSPMPQPPQVAPQAPGAGPSPNTLAGAGVERKDPTPTIPAELAAKPVGQPSTGLGAFPTVPRPAAGAANDAKKVPAAPAPKKEAAVAPTGQKSTAKTTSSAPQPAGVANQAAAGKPAPADSANALRDATQAAKAAVAVAMAKLGGGAAAQTAAASVVPGPQYTNGSSAMDNLTRKVNEMRVNAAVRTGPASHGFNNNNAHGGSGRGGAFSGTRPVKVDVPDADFDFASSNAKFSKADVVKEVSGSGGQPDARADASDASASVSAPVSSRPAGATSSAAASADGNGNGEAVPVAYNKTTSFFDNISSEAKDRAEKGSQKAGGREWRGEEQRRNMETFGQSSVDGGYRGYRGRGRGRGRGGYGRGRGGGGYRRNNDQQGIPQ